VTRHKPVIGLPMVRRISLILSAALISFPGFAIVNAQDTGPLPARQQTILTLESAVRSAVKWYPSIDQAIAALSASSQDIKEAQAGYRPQVSAGIGPSMSITGGTSWRPRATLSASQMLYDFGKVGSSVDRAKAAERASRAELLLAVDNLSRNTSFSVIEAQRYRALLTIAQEQLTSLEEINGLVQLRVRRGASTRSDGSQAEARIEAARATILQITAEVQRWESNLRYLVGWEGPLDVAPDVPDWLGRACRVHEPDWDQLPSVMQSVAKRDEAQAAYRGARAAGLPTVSMGADVDTNLRDPFAQRNDVTVGITVSSSLYQGGARKARESASFHMLESADAALKAARIEAGRTLAENSEQIDSLIERFATLGKRRADMEETGTLYRLQYFQLGTRTLLDLLNAQQEYHQTRFDEVNAVHDMRRLNVDCLYYSGALRDAYALTGTIVRGVTL